MADTEPAIRELLTQIGILMEDTSPVALLWRQSDLVSVRDRLLAVKRALAEMQLLTMKIEKQLLE
ncbi:hypothetical protein [Sphingorhabdus lacus]|uniref:hypothetical protein n=1 Tax=Sphingorhabdus lacus TaxID=392610 RepID=UPI00359472C5